MKSLVDRLRSDFQNEQMNYTLIFAYNGVGKTRLSMEFKNRGKHTRDPNMRDTLYFNAFTEDLFTWDNDLESDTKRCLKINTASRFFAGLEDLEMETRIRALLNRYVDYDFNIDIQTWEVSFSRDVTIGEGTNARTETIDYIKVSRGEENIFIWCFFLAIVQIAMDKDISSYNLVKYVYIDDPISSLDENNAIAVAHDLAGIMIESKGKLKFVISTHHALFFNVVCNELNSYKHNQYFLYRSDSAKSYALRATNDTPFFHHVAMLSEIYKADKEGKLYTYHFNVLRGIMEKTAVFFGRESFGACLSGLEDEALYSRALNLLSHGKYSLYEPVEMMEDNKELFHQIFNAFLEKHAFDLPVLHEE